MKKLLGSVAFTAVMLAAVAAQAAVVAVTSVSGSSVSPTFQGGVAGSTYITFEDVAPGTTGAFVSNGFSFTGVGAVENTNLVNAYAAPAGDATHYLTTGFDGTGGLKTELLSVGGPHTNFGLYWGSIDTYNKLVFISGGVDVFSATNLNIPSPGNGDQGSDLTNRYVNFAFISGTYDAVRFESTTPAFEVDNIAIAGAVPELSTWGMMLLGFAGVGLVAYRRSRKSALAAA